MRLLNVKTFKLEDFVTNIPPYAILSHTWGDEEVIFEDMRSGNGDNKAGYAKILGCCARAEKDGYKYCWIDTCCIDKSSSAELSEAINSMYRWYANADLCYVYLSDIHTWYPGTLYSDEMCTLFDTSRWFSRGWTLQELIAPRYVEFYAADWTEIGTKLSLAERLYTITSVPVKVLLGRSSISQHSVGARMSWAASRITTRVEDRAYCLLGIFEVNMPLLYGEGIRAFVRLQEEILRTIHDFTIFAWADMPLPWRPSGLLATSPRSFEWWKGHKQLESLRTDERANTHDPPMITNRGIKLALKIVARGSEKLAYLNLCSNFSTPSTHLVVLIKTSAATPSSYFRSSDGLDGLAWISRSELDTSPVETLYLLPLHNVVRSSRPDRGALVLVKVQFKKVLFLLDSGHDLKESLLDYDGSVVLRYRSSVVYLLVEHCTLSRQVLIQLSGSVHGIGCRVNLLKEDLTYDPKNGSVENHVYRILHDDPKSFSKLLSDRAVLFVPVFSDPATTGGGRIDSTVKITVNLKRVSNDLLEDPSVLPDLEAELFVLDIDAVEPT